MFSLDDKLAIVTGGARGIGRSIALSLADQGSQVAIVDILPEEASSVCDEIGHKAQAYAADLAKVPEINKVINKIISDHGKIDILVNNAGICPRLPFGDSPEDDWDHMNNVNAKSQYFMMQAVCPYMKKQGGGRIINMASSSGRIGSMNNASIYSGTKGSVIMFSKAVAREVAKDGILINCIAPGLIATPLITDLPQEQLDILYTQIPLGRLGEPKEVAAIVAFLASDEASYLTGAVIDVTGGWKMP